MNEKEIKFTTWPHLFSFHEQLLLKFHWTEFVEFLDPKNKEIETH